MQPPLKPNHLATILDYQKAAAVSLPKSLMEKCIELSKLTEEIKRLLESGLPEEILKTLWVVHYVDGKLTISVQSQTAANHLRYQANNLLHILSEQSLTFYQLKHIDVIVTHSVLNDPLGQSKALNPDETQRSNHADAIDENHVTHGLTETMKRTISYTSEHVITDERLKKALKRLIKP